VSLFKTRNSAVADKPRDAFVQMQWRGWPLKTRPSLYVLPCRISSFCVEGCRHKYRSTPKIGQPWKSAILGRRRGWPKIHAHPHMCCHVKFGSSATKGVRINRKDPRNWGALGSRPLVVGASMTPRNTPWPSPPVILPNLVVLGQTVWVLLRRSAWKIWLVSRLQRSLKVIGIDSDDFLFYP